MLCCVVLCCAVLCCAVLCCAVLCCAVLYPDLQLYSPILFFFFPCLAHLEDARTTTRRLCE